MKTSQILADPAEPLEVDHGTVSKRLKALRMIQRKGNWVPYEMEPSDVERHLSTYEQLLQRQKRKGFLYRIVNDDEK